MEEKYKFKSYSKHENGAYENYKTQSVWARETAFKNEGNASEHMPARVHCESSQIVSLSIVTSYDISADYLKYHDNAWREFQVMVDMASTIQNQLELKVEYQTRQKHFEACCKTTSEASDNQ